MTPTPTVVQPTPFYTPNPNQDSVIFGFDYLTVVNFDNAYWRSQPDEVEKLFSMDPTQPARRALAMQLSNMGYKIDEVIMVYGQDAYMTMRARQASGYSSLQAMNGATIRVSVNIGDFPPFDPKPVPVTTIGFVSLVGISSGSKYVNPNSPYNGWQMYNENPNADNSLLNPDQSYSLDPRGIFYKMVVQTPFGPEIYFMLKP